VAEAVGMLSEPLGRPQGEEPVVVVSRCRCEMYVGSLKLDGSSGKRTAWADRSGRHRGTMLMVALREMQDKSSKI
jgi:hypothetical protein